MAGALQRFRTQNLARSSWLLGLSLAISLMPNQGIHQHRQRQLLKYEPLAWRLGLDFPLMLTNQLNKVFTRRQRHYVDLSKRQWEHVCFRLRAMIRQASVLRAAIQQWRMHTTAVQQWRMHSLSQAAVLRLAAEPAASASVALGPPRSVRAWVERPGIVSFTCRP